MGRYMTMQNWTPEQWILLITALCASLGGMITSIIAAVRSSRAATASNVAANASTIAATASTAAATATAAHSTRLDDIQVQTNGTLERQLEINRGLRTALTEEKLRSAKLQDEVVRRADLAMPPQMPPLPEK